MSSESRKRWIGSTGLVGAIILGASALTIWKSAGIRAADAAAASQPEPIESVSAAVAVERPHRETTTSIGTVLALRSITLRNEVAGLVREVALTPGDVVDAGAVLVALDVSVEEAELAAQEAQASLAQTTLSRLEILRRDGAASDEEVDQARAQRDVALAQIERTRAIIGRKTIRAPFRARVGIADVHPGQYLNEGTHLTTLQGVDDAVHVDFAVAQQVAAGLREGEQVQVFAGIGEPIAARIVAVDARVDPITRNAIVRARMGDGANRAAPGASVRVVIPVGRESIAVLVPATALRKGPAGDHVFVVTPDSAGQTRAHLRQVESGAMVGDQVVIAHGLQAGELVAAQGSFKLWESVAVNVAGGEPSAQSEGGAQ
jgi:membrane fusion protein (multidrug efflux system)